MSWERGLTCIGVVDVIREDTFWAMTVILLASITLHKRELQTLGWVNTMKLAQLVA